MGELSFYNAGNKRSIMLYGLRKKGSLFGEAKSAEGGGGKTVKKRRGGQKKEKVFLWPFLFLSIPLDWVP